MNRKRLLASAVGALVAAAIAGGVANATIPGPGDVYSACMLKGVGTIRLIDKSLPAANFMSHCTDKETEISWNQAGQPGPAGRPPIPKTCPQLLEALPRRATCSDVCEAPTFQFVSPLPRREVLHRTGQHGNLQALCLAAWILNGCWV